MSRRRRASIRCRWRRTCTGRELGRGPGRCFQRFRVRAWRGEGVCGGGGQGDEGGCSWWREEGENAFRQGPQTRQWRWSRRHEQRATIIFHPRANTNRMRDYYGRRRGVTCEEEELRFAASDVRWW